MTIELPDLPYAPDALEPVISAETIEYHYGKHHQGYVNKLNAAVDGDLPLEEIVRSSEGATFNNAAQVWNHNFYWKCMTPGGNFVSNDRLLDAVNTAFGSMEGLKEAFLGSARSNFASGWTWLVVDEGVLKVVNTDDADTPIVHNQHPILTVDVWEHAYYIDYRNGRGSYLSSWWDIIDWDFVGSQFDAA